MGDFQVIPMYSAELRLVLHLSALVIGCLAWQSAVMCFVAWRVVRSGGDE